MSARFSPGRLLATPGALALLENAGQDPLALLARHVSGDWGNIPPEDAAENEISVREGFRVLSAYQIGDLLGARVWLLTEADRSSTCILLPEEY